MPLISVAVTAVAAISAVATLVADIFTAVISAAADGGADPASTWVTATTTITMTTMIAIGVTAGASAGIKKAPIPLDHPRANASTSTEVGAFAVSKFRASMVTGAGRYPRNLFSRYRPSKKWTKSSVFFKEYSRPGETVNPFVPESCYSPYTSCPSPRE
jgi:hypothetical protein